MLIVIAGFQQRYGEIEAIKPRLGIWMSIDDRWKAEPKYITRNYLINTQELKGLIIDRTKPLALTVAKERKRT